MQTPYEIKLPTCIRKTIEYQHYRYRQGQQPALASPRRTARYERIPPDGFDMAALEVTLCGGTPPPPNGGSPRTERSPLPCGHLPTPWGVTFHFRKVRFFHEASPHPVGSHPFQGRLYTSLQTPYEIKLSTYTRKHLNINITDTDKGNNRRWQAPGGQRGTSEFRRTVSTRLT